VALIYANNETGVIQPMEAIAQLVAAGRGHLHLDVTQALGKIPVDLVALGARSAACSAHKLNGPKGVGALLVRGDDPAEALLVGGPQEQRRRGGTENVAGIVGFGEACALARAELTERAARYAELRDRLWQGLQAKIPNLRRNGHPEHVLPNTLSVEFVGTAGEVLLQALDLEGVAASMGAACHSGSVEPSHVLKAMGRTPDEARASLRFSVGHGVDEAQIDRTLALCVELVARVRAAETL
jgi:cysteine desulfurase